MKAGKHIIFLLYSFLLILKFKLKLYIMIKKYLIFPYDFESTTHRIVPGATQWLWKNDDIKISIVGGGEGLMGNGVVSFEMWDSREDDIQGYRTKDEINEHLKKFPVE
jgi:hypothetical protein